MDHTHDIIELARREMAQRRYQEMERSVQAAQPWLWAFLGLSLTLIAGVFLLPMGTLADRLQGVVRGVCAQQHFIRIGAYTMPLCARNTGIYAGFLATILYLLALGRGRAAKLPPWPIVGLLGIAIVAMGIDGFNSLALDVGGYNVYPPDNRLRVVTGLGMGTAMGTFMLLMLNLSLRYDVRHEQRVVSNWVEVLGMFVTGALLYGLLFFAPTWLFYPLAIFSLIGIVGVLFLSNLFVVAMVSGLENRVIKLRQLARPATYSLACTAAELALLAGLRYWMEQSLGMTA